jgi:hypothetical protein
MRDMESDKDIGIYDSVALPGRALEQGHYLFKHTVAAKMRAVQVLL